MPPEPDPLAVARATVLDPESVNLHPGLIYDAWARLKEARGDGIARPELLLPMHQVRRGGCGGTVEAIDAARGRTAARIRSMLFRPVLGGGAA